MSKSKNIIKKKHIRDTSSSSRQKRDEQPVVDLGLGTIEPIEIKPEPEPIPTIPLIENIPVEDKPPDKKSVIPLKEPDRLDKLQRSISLILMSIGFMIIISGCIYRYTGFKWYIDTYADEVITWVISTQRR